MCKWIWTGRWHINLTLIEKKMQSKGLWGKKYPMMKCKGSYAYFLDDKKMQCHDM
jgi:hypothetical protein